MDKILFIINPIAGKERGEDLIPLIEKTMKENNREFKIEISQRERQATKIAEENLETYNTLVAVGGDGTVNEVARGIINRGKGTLAIIPCGTGNDMAKVLGLSKDPIEALETIVRGRTRKIDIGKANNQYFLNIASVGFDSEVVRNNIKIKKRIRHEISYTFSVIYTLFKYRNKKAIVEIDGKVTEENILLLAVGNGRYYGGGLEILPMSKLDDGFLHVCLVSNVNKAVLFILFPSIFNGSHFKHKKYVRGYKAKNINVKTEEDVMLNVDGEVKNTREVNFSMEDIKLNVIVNQ